MHKQHEDQPSNELPDLPTWCRVPIGATAALEKELDR